jgi:AbrB family looped-hinge helix DNA binding protein
MDMAHRIDNNSVLQNPYRWSDAMPTVTVSPKFQVVIPKEVREAMAIEPGQKMSIMVYKGHMVLIPILPMDQLRGFAKGIDATFEREEDRL